MKAKLAVILGMVALVAGSLVVVHLVTSHAAQVKQQKHVRAAERRTAAVRAKDPRPNIVMVLMDDASYELMASMRNAQKMRADGATYLNAHVVDSLCCPSRTSIFTGQPPHLNGVLSNTAGPGPRPLGGYQAFAAHNDAPKAFNLALQKAGYTTGFIGKYLNGYEMGKGHGAPPAIPGWTHFRGILGGGYHEWGFYTAVQDNGGAMHLVHNPKPPRSSPTSVLDAHYATNVASDVALRFLEDRRLDPKPYFLEVATYAPHLHLKKAYPDDPSFPPAFADRAPKGDPTGGNCGTTSCAKVTLKELRGYADNRADNAPTYLHGNGRTTRAPAWNHDPITLTPKKALEELRDRVRMVQAVDRMIGRIRKAVGPNTYVVLSSDNGYHLGQLQLNGGKGTPYDFDTRVPLVVDGPHVTPGNRSQFVSLIDLAPTFERLAGLKPPGFVAGLSFAQTLRHPQARAGHFVFFDHTFAPTTAGEVDGDRLVGGNIETIPSYIGVRGPRGLLVREDLNYSSRGHRYAWELYDYRAGFEKTNVFARDHDQPWARQLMRRLMMWDGCQPARCRAAAR